MREERSKRSHKAVYTVVEREKDGKAFWTRIGAAFENRDGSWSVILEAVPINGKLQIREPFQDREQGKHARRGRAMAS